MYKMLCLDIDGTLLNSNHKISVETKNTIKKLSKEKNIPVILVSARMPKGIDFLQEELEIKEPIICYSGALVLDKKYNTIFKNYIESENVRKIIEKTKKYNLHVSIYSDERWIIEKADKWSKIESDIICRKPEILGFDNLTTNLNCEVNKILVIGDEAEISEINKLLNEELGDKLNIYQSKSTYLEIMNKDVSKPKAIEKLLSLYDIDPSEIVAIGDNYNDMDMLKYAGVGIAMGNAPRKVKDSSDFITLSNDEDGIVTAVNKFFY